MASSSITPFKDASNQVTFTLASTSELGAKYMVSGRALAAPYVVEIKRKINPNSTANDHVQLRVARTEPNATTQKPATVQCLLDLSIPKDVSVLTPTLQKEIATLLMSLLRDGTLSATFVNVTALIEGRDL